VEGEIMMEEQRLSARMQDALDLAIRLHGKDSRKRSSVPMLAHLLGACALTLQDGGSEDEGIAALLHDALEDKGDQVSAREIGERFGDPVRTIVELCTDTPAGYTSGPKPTWKERKLDYLGRVRRADPSLLRVTVADKVDNLRAIVADYRRVGEGLWERFSAGKGEQLWYFDQALEAYRASCVAGPLIDEMEWLVGELKRLSAPV
jgi:(p)ppGpp synthase/HD superfamily hydrolase